jgi:hypothetical protein
MPGWVRALQVIFVVAVAFIAAVVLYGPSRCGMPATSRSR